MRIVIIRFLNAIFFSVLLALLVASSLLYFYYEAPTMQLSFSNWLDYHLPWVAEQLLPLSMYYDSRVGIGLVFLFVIVYFVNGVRKRPPSHDHSNFVAFFVAIVFILTIGTVAAIYYWPEGTIRLGNFVKFQRGPRDKFLQQTIDIAILVAVVHMLFFLVGSIYHWIFGKRPAFTN